MEYIYTLFNNSLYQDVVIVLFYNEGSFTRGVLMKQSKAIEHKVLVLGRYMVSEEWEFLKGSYT